MTLNLQRHGFTTSLARFGNYRFLAGLYLACVLILWIAPPASAQITPTARVELNDNRTRFFFGPQIYLTEDPDFRLNPQVIITRHQNNLRGLRQENEVLNLGAKPKPSWMVFSVTNNSSREGWVLHFGNVADGRFGHIRHILVYNESSKQTLIRHLPDNQPFYNAGGLKGAAFPLRLAKGQTQLFVVYLDMSDGMAHTLRPAFITYDRYLRDLMLDTFPAGGFAAAMLIFAGLFAAFSFLKKKAEYLHFSLYFILQLLFYRVTDMTFLIENAVLSTVMPVLFVAPAVAGAFLTQRFFDLNANDETPSTLLFLATAIMVSCLFFSFFLPGRTTSTDEYMLFVPAILGTGICTAVSFTQSQQGKFGGVYMAGAWIAGLAAYISFFVASMGFSSPSMFTLYWLFLLPQGGFFLIAAIRKINLEQEENLLTMARESRTAQSLARLKQSKESADQARLLRVIERERELMAELREREIQRTEDMRRAKEAADEANRAKSAFLAVVSHEIRTPMNGIMGMVRLLMDSKMTKQQTEYLQTIQNSGDTMMALLNDILDFEKIESGKMQIEDIDFDMARLVHGVVTLMSGHAAEKGIELRADIAGNFPQTLKGDPTRLRQILLNLVSNAIKFTASGSVTIRLKSTPSVEKQNEEGLPVHEIQCAVEDTGIGISEDALKNLFNPFQQAEKSTARKYGGTGLGLAICRRLLEAMGSVIQVKSAEGKGSTFFFTLWLEEGSAEVRETAGNGERESYMDIFLPPMDILIIEDNELNRKVLKGFLEKGNHRLTLCGSAEEALEICERQRFDAILTDIGLGGLDGMEFTRLLRENLNPRISETPVIALTGNVGLEDQVRYRDAGMNGFLGKPIDPEKLFGILASLDRAPRGGTDDDKENEDFDSFAEALSAEEDGEEEEARRDTEASTAPEKNAESERSGVLDASILESLAEALPSAQLKELLRSFTDKADELVDALRDPTNAENAVFLRDRAHELKGMAANFGLREISALAGAIEKFAKSGDVENAGGEIKKLADAYRRAYMELQNWQDLQ